MEIIAGSQSGAAESFLHAGYISAYPRKAEGYTLSPYVNKDAELIVVSEALALKNEAALKVLPRTRPAPASLPTNSLAVTAGGVTLFFSVLLTAAWLKQNPKGKRLLKLTGLLALALGAVFIGACFQTTKPNQANVVKREYVNPEQATKTILYAIIGDAVPNVKGPVKNLAKIRKEVALPTTSPTAGESYALQTYAFDGWGREFQLSAGAKGATVITSAGADGQFGTNDDLSISASRSKYDWEYDRKGIYLHRTDKDYHVFLHRSNHRLFRYHDKGLAAKLTGSSLYDVVPLDQLGKNNRKALDDLVGDNKGLMFLMPGVTKDKKAVN